MELKVEGQSREARCLTIDLAFSFQTKEGGRNGGV